MNKPYFPEDPELVMNGDEEDAQIALALALYEKHLEDKGE